MNRRATQQCNMSPYVYAVYWLPPASSAFLLANKCNWLAEKMLITCVMRHARLQKLQRFRRKMPFYSFLILWCWCVCATCQLTLIVTFVYFTVCLQRACFAIACSQTLALHFPGEESKASANCRQNSCSGYIIRKLIINSFWIIISRLWLICLWII